MAIIGRRTLGLDLGSHTVKAVELQAGLRGVDVGQLCQIPTEDPRDPRPLAERIRELLQSHKLAAEHVVCAVPSDRLTGRRLSFPFRDARRLSQAIPLAVSDELPFETHDVLMDWELVGGDRSQAEVLASVVPRGEVARLIDLLRAAGAEPRVVEAEGLVLGGLAGWLELGGAHVLADFGARKTTLCLCYEGQPIATRSIPLGGQRLTEALAGDLALPLERAEAAKLEQGVRGRESAMRCLDRLTREIVRSLGAFEPALAARGAGRIDGLVLLGGGAHLRDLDRYLGERLGLPVSRPAPPGEAGVAFVAAGDPAQFGPAAALALRGSLKARTRTNFRQDEFAVRFDLGQLVRELAWTGVLAGIALILLGVLAGTSIVLESRHAEAVEQEVSRLYASAFPGRPPPANVMGSMRNAVRSAHERADFLGVYRGNLSALDLLAEISALVPPDLEVVFEELSIDRQVVRIRGHSRSFEAVDRLRAELARYEPFSQIKVSEIQRDARLGANSFNLTISLAAPEAS